MATRTAVMTEVPLAGGEGIAYLVTWSGLLNGDDGEPVTLPGFNDRSVQVEGTFGSGGSARVQGSLDGTNFETLHDPGGNALDMTAASIKAVLEATVKTRPKITAGDGSTSLVVSILFNRTRR